MCKGGWVGDGLLQMVVVHICFDINGDDLGDQVISGPVHKPPRTDPATRKALAESSMSNMTLREAVQCSAVLYLFSQLGTKSNDEAMRQCPLTIGQTQQR